MANTKSAEKRQRQNEKRRMRNKAARSRMRTAIKGVRSALQEGEADKARELLPEAIRVIDVTRRKNVIHANTAARTKSRLTRAVNAAAEPQSATAKSAS
jgi:small subunit ribosomal protein S20